jgi:hypothetical protein
MTTYYALILDSCTLAYLGDFKEWDEANEKAERMTNGALWVVSEETAKTLAASISTALQFGIASRG